MKDMVCVPAAAPLRPPSKVMRLAQLGSMFPTRLSFLRSLTRRLAAEKAVLSNPVWAMDDAGHGHAVYSIPLGGYVYSLVAITQPLPADQRTDRVIATAWDAAFVLYDGVPDAEEIARICANAPHQESGRFTVRDLVLSRANKSVRLFEALVADLKAGRAIDTAMIRDTGYLMRTTAVYGNGKFGIADRADIAARPGLGGPFAAEMLTVWLIRHFTHDLVEFLGGAPLPRAIKRHLGIGNSTGLGMAPFLVSHPLLLDAWICARETAVARVRATQTVTLGQAKHLVALAHRGTGHLNQWQVPDTDHQARNSALAAQWAGFAAGLTTQTLQKPGAMEQIFQASQERSADFQEFTLSWMLEPFGDLIDGLTECMANPFLPRLDPAMACSELRSLIERQAHWALTPDFAAPKACGQFWYVSEEKLEPRLGQRHTEAGAERESPLDIARRIQGLYGDLKGVEGPIWRFLADHPEHRFAATRVQTLARHPYAEIHDNLIDATCAPIDMLRCKLSFFGAAKFDPKSTLWTRVTLAQGAPLADELTADVADDWWCPVFAP